MSCSLVSALPLLASSPSCASFWSRVFPQLSHHLPRPPFFFITRKKIKPRLVLCYITESLPSLHPNETFLLNISYPYGMDPIYILCVATSNVHRLISKASQERCSSNWFFCLHFYSTLSIFLTSREKFETGHFLKRPISRRATLF